MEDVDVTEPISLEQASDRIFRGDLSPYELVSSVLERIDLINPHLEAYVSVFHEEALVEAGRASDEIAAHGPRGPLHGIPIAVKDLYDMRANPRWPARTFARVTSPTRTAKSCADCAEQGRSSSEKR